jgi:hypothetical protein
METRFLGVIEDLFVLGWDKEIVVRNVLRSNSNSNNSLCTKVVSRAT